MPRPRPLPPPLDDGPFAVRDALAAGVSPAQLRRSTLTSPYWGVRIAADDADDLLARCAAARLVLPDGAVFSHVTALRLRGVELPRRLERDLRVHVVVPARGQRTQRAEIVAHVSVRSDVARTRVAGLAVTSPAQTWLHCAGGLDLDALVVLGDAMLRRDAALTSARALARVAAASSGARGARTARLALPFLRPGTDSSMETRARLVLVHAGLPCPAVNEPVRDPLGRFVARPDLSYPQRRIAIEYDGDVHRTDARTWRRDIARRQEMEALGWRVVTLTADDVIRRPARLIALVRGAIEAAARR